ncbi:Prephenate dehydratase-domain-containing protein [Ampelomyces quisqualis]|uniref:prephenate dehydratase n=1 Tax=Ampelomyces quisqualis TaxID=50730 RepID=A0A6A5QLI0_AMPQU|nr:Prephenate dehydratase-domain-containing protein [Ampelomyces quisqualis]
MANDERPAVAFLGPEASYTHQAALSTFPPTTHSLSPCTTIADVFTAVQSGTAHRGVVPFENSSNGSVIFTFDLIGDLHGTHPDILVCGEAYVPVKHCLLGHSIPNAIPTTGRNVQFDAKFTNPLAVPRSDLSKITKLYSHPQAWGQCKAFLDTYLKGVERQDVSSTSRAAELVAADPFGGTAALSSHVAAKVFGLDVLAESINDHLGNTTRFLVIRRRDSALAPQEDKHKNDKQDKWKSLLTFTVDHAHPGALAKCLTVFEKYALNLTSINTRPSGVENWNYVFFVEFDGRKEDDEAQGNVNKALNDVSRICKACSWKGSWKSRLELSTSAV